MITAAAMKNSKMSGRQLKALVTDDDEKRRKSELARFSINEISAANIRPGELAELTDKRQIMRNAEKIA